MPKLTNGPDKAKKSKASGQKKSPVLACIDIGTNSFHMIVCRSEPKSDDFEIISRVKDVAPFFRQALTNHYIDEAAQNSAREILKNMLKHAQEKGAESVTAVATSAVRESKNGHAVISQLGDELSLNIRVISGKEEARLIYLGVVFSMPNLTGRFAIVDIGGGSTEIIAADRENCYFSDSYKLGAARLTQRFFPKERVTREALTDLHDEVRGMLRPAAVAIKASGGYKQLIGTSGTVQALAKLDRVQMGRTNESLDGWVLPLERLEDLVDYIEERALDGVRIKGISTDRGQTILAGAIVLLETMRSLGASELTVCTAALREGVAVDQLLQADLIQKDLKSHKDPRAKSVLELLERYNTNVEHAVHVAKLACSIFRQTKEILHDLPDDSEHLLWSAAMLHDIGTFISRKGHHKHSYYLILHSGLLGHSEEEVGMIASVARYHRGTFPSVDHEAWYRLDESDKNIVKPLAAILRISEALDRSHRGVIEDVQVAMSSFKKAKAGQITTVSLIPQLKEGTNCLAESWALGEKKDFFEEVFEVNLDLLVEAKQKLKSTARART